MKSRVAQCKVAKHKVLQNVKWGCKAIVGTAKRKVLQNVKWERKRRVYRRVLVAVKKENILIIDLLTQHDE